VKITRDFISQIRLPATPQFVGIDDTSGNNWQQNSYRMAKFLTPVPYYAGTLQLKGSARAPGAVVGGLANLTLSSDGGVCVQRGCGKAEGARRSELVWKTPDFGSSSS